MTRLDEDELLEFMDRCGAPRLREVAMKALTVSDGKKDRGVHQELVEGFRQALIAEFGGKVLADKIRPNPPDRGKNCVAELVLKPRAESKKQRAMQFSGEGLKAMEDVTAEWFPEGKIKPGKGPWSSPCFPVSTKTKGKWRGVVDMMHVDEQCVEDAYALLRVEDMLVQQGAREIHSALDLKYAFHKMPLAEPSRYITCTATPRGIFQ